MLGNSVGFGVPDDLNRSQINAQTIAAAAATTTTTIMII